MDASTRTKQRKAANTTQRPRHALKALASQAGCQLTTLGDTEQLAGVDVSSPAARRELWDRFRHLYHSPTQVLVDAVMDHCSAIALRRIKAGELCLVRTVSRFACATVG